MLFRSTATKKFPYITYGIDKYTEDSNTLRGVGYGSSVKEVIDAYGDFKLSLVWTKNPLDPLPKEQWEGYTLEKYANNNMDFLKNCEIVYLEFGIQKQGEIWSVCTRDRYKEKEPLEEVTEYWLSICLENGKVSNIYLDSKYLGERDLDALYAQIQEERGLTASN